MTIITYYWDDQKWKVAKGEGKEKKSLSTSYLQYMALLIYY